MVSFLGVDLLGDYLLPPAENNHMTSDLQQTSVCYPLSDWLLRMIDTLVLWQWLMVPLSMLVLCYPEHNLM